MLNELLASEGSTIKARVRLYVASVNGICTERGILFSTLRRLHNGFLSVFVNADLSLSVSKLSFGGFIKNGYMPSESVHLGASPDTRTLSVAAFASAILDSLKGGELLTSDHLCDSLLHRSFLLKELSARHLLT